MRGNWHQFLKNGMPERSGNAVTYTDIRDRAHMPKRKPKKVERGSGFSVTLPTEPMAGAAKNAKVMAVLVQDEGVPLSGVRDNGRGKYCLPGRRHSAGVHGARRSRARRRDVHGRERGQRAARHRRVRARAVWPADGRSASRAATNDQPGSESALEDYRAELGVADGSHSSAQG